MQELFIAMEELRSAIGDIPQGVRHCRSHHSFESDGVIEHYFSWPKKKFKALANTSALVSFPERTAATGYKYWVSLSLKRVEAGFAEFHADDDVYRIRL